MTYLLWASRTLLLALLISWISSIVSMTALFFVMTDFNPLELGLFKRIVLGVAMPALFPAMLWTAFAVQKRKKQLFKGEPS